MITNLPMIQISVFCRCMLSFTDTQSLWRSAGTRLECLSASCQLIFTFLIVAPFSFMFAVFYIADVMKWMSNQ